MKTSHERDANPGSWLNSQPSSARSLECLQQKTEPADNLEDRQKANYFASTMCIANCHGPRIPRPG